MPVFGISAIARQPTGQPIGVVDMRHNNVREARVVIEAAYSYLERRRRPGAMMAFQNSLRRLFAHRSSSQFHRRTAAECIDLRHCNKTSFGLARPHLFVSNMVGDFGGS